MKKKIMSKIIPMLLSISMAMTSVDVYGMELATVNNIIMSENEIDVEDTNDADNIKEENDNRVDKYSEEIQNLDTNAAMEEKDSIDEMRDSEVEAASDELYVYDAVDDMSSAIIDDDSLKVEAATSYRSGDGTEANPYIISNLEEFLYFGQDTSKSYKYFRLTSDIYFNTSLDNPVNDFVNKGGSKYHFDGASCTIYNFYSSNGNAVCNDAEEVSYLTVNNAKILNGSCVIGGSNIYACIVTGDLYASVSQYNSKFSGISSSVREAHYCTYDANLKKIGTDSITFSFSGIANTVSDAMSYCKNSGMVSSDTGSVYGIAYDVDGQISNCSTTENCELYSGTGTVCGIAYSVSGSIDNCTNEAKLEGSVTCGLLYKLEGSDYGSSAEKLSNKGTLKSHISDSNSKSECYGIAAFVLTYYYDRGARYSDVDIDDCKNEGLIDVSVEGSGDAVASGLFGKIDGQHSSITISNCVNKGKVQSISGTGGGSLCGLATEIYITDDCEDGVIIQNCSNEGEIVSNRTLYCSGLITNMGSTTRKNSDNNILIVDCKNLGNVTSVSSASGIVSTLYYGTVEKCTNTGVISSDQVASGIVGATSGSTSKYGNLPTVDAEVINIIKCVNSGRLKSHGYSSAAGGIVGNMYFGSIESCYNAGSIVMEGNSGNVGGVCGNIFVSTSDIYGNITVKNCFNVGKIDASNSTNKYVGGLFGWISVSNENVTVNINNIYNAGTVLASQTYSNGPSEYTGGISSSVSNRAGRIVMSGLYYLDGIRPWHSYYSGVSSISAKALSKAQLAQKSSFSGFDFNNVWYFNSSSSEYLYPMLKDVEASALASISDDVLIHRWRNIEWKLSNGILTIMGTGAIPNLDYDEKAPWYENKDDIESIVIADGMTGIGTRWFDGLERVESVTISNTVTSIGMSAFAKCAGLSELIIPNSVTSIGMNAFADCTGLKNVTIPNSVTSLGVNAFANCSELREITFPEGIKRIEGGLFNGCKKLEKISLPSTIEFIYAEAFSGCDNFHIIDYNGVKNDWDAKLRLTKELDKFLGKQGVSIRFTDGTIGGQFLYVTFEEGNHTSNYEYNFDYRWFNNSSYNYNHDLARTSLKVAMSGIAKTGPKGAMGKEYEDAATENIRKLMDGMGFEYDYSKGKESESYESINYPKSLTRDDYDNIGTAIGSKTIINNGREESLVLLVIRGGGYMAEWGGNLRVGNTLYGTDHRGFEYAANTVVNRLDEYFAHNSQKMKDNVNVWIVGYSRSAAVANIVGAKIDDGILQNIDVASENVFEYGFECPQNTTNVAAHASRYNNLFSIINPDDLVPKVAPSSIPFWNFTRYGKTYSVPRFIGQKDNSAFRKRNDKYLEILDYLGTRVREEYNKNNPNKWLGLSLIYDDLIDLIADLVSSRDAYAISYQSTMMDVAAKSMSKYADKNIDYNVGGMAYSVVAALFREVLGVEYGELALKREIANLCTGLGNIGVNWLVIDNDPLIIFSLIKPAHLPELCLAWMESLDGDEVIAPKGIRKVLVNCPVDVTVRDEDGNIVGQIIDDKPVVIDEGIFTYYDSNNQKVIILPMDAEYDLQFEATDDGEMTYTVVESLDTEYIPQKIVSFEDVTIRDGEKLSSSIEECIETEAEYELIHESGRAETADISLEGSDVYFCNISVETEGPGIVLNAGNFVPGSYCTLKAESVRNVESDFIGWFEEGAGDDAEPISTEIEYRFPVSTDVNLVAKFRDISGQMWVADIDAGECDFTGSPVTPTLKVYDGENLLTEKVDYTVTYKNNTKAYLLSEGDEGFDPKKAPLIIVTGKGNYTSKETVYFKIYPKNITDEDVSVSEYNTVLSNGKIQRPVPTVTIGKKKLSVNKDYTVNFYSSYDVIDSKVGPMNVGTYYVVIEGIGNYTDSVVREFVIENSSTKKLISKLKLTKIKDKAYQNGEDVLLTVEELNSLINDGGEWLKCGEDKDFTVTYSDNVTDVGKVTVTISGTGIKYVGKTSVSYNITGIPLKKVKIDGFVSKFDYAGGNEINQPATLSYKESSKSPAIELRGISLVEYESMEDDSEKRNYDYTYEYSNNIYPGTATVNYSGINNYYGNVAKTYKITGIPFSKVKINNFANEIEYTGEAIEQTGAILTYTSSDGAISTLEMGTDYTVEYKSNINAGKATVTYTGIGAYDGKVNKNFNIVPYDIVADSKAKTIIYYIDEVPYSKNGAKSEITVKYGDETLEYKKDYVIVYSNNKNLYAYDQDDVLNFSSKKAPTVKVTGKGNYKGTCLVYYKIDQADISDEMFSVTIPDIVYKDKAGIVKSQPVITDADGKKLSVGKDYDRTIDYYYEYIPEGLHVTDGRDANRPILTRNEGNLVQDYDIAPAGTIIRAVTRGIGTYKGVRDGLTSEDDGYDTYRIVEQSIAGASANVEVKTYTGKEIYLSDEDITLTIGSKNNKKELHEGVDYIILNDTYKNNVKNGKATVTIKGINGYGGTKTLTFTIGAKGFLWWWRNLLQ